ncbi:hypothetical protein MtrunA17_Chr1g0213821 [Medicago truncatula]|uniref:Uncharacterized protein n=1 Tax=Medicago truncatula TaxID=3880 RepID=A0A396K085_MEDTR|nr:hypothetical protein MtrunA17_Chr1g0213821 [Medicago truncatula]
MLHPFSVIFYPPSNQPTAASSPRLRHHYPLTLFLDPSQPYTISLLLNTSITISLFLLSPSTQDFSLLHHVYCSFN